jgi:hypothetical protein
MYARALSRHSRLSLDTLSCKLRAQEGTTAEEDTHIADPPHPETGDDAGVEPGGDSTTGTPRWVKVFGIVALLVVLVFVILVVTGRGGEHGPGRHSPSGDRGGTTSSVPESHAPPAGGHAPPAGITGHDERQP